MPSIFKSLTIINTYLKPTEPNYNVKTQVFFRVPRTEISDVHKRPIVIPAANHTIF